MTMPTYEQVYCAKHGCDRMNFRQKVFWACLPFHARLIAAVIGGFDASCFAADRDLIAGVSDATTMRGVREEIRDFFMDPVNMRWSRRMLKVRVSSKKLKSHAQQFLQEERPRNRETAHKFDR